MKKLIMSLITIREPRLEDEHELIKAINISHDLHYPWVNPPNTHQEFLDYLDRYQQNNHRSYLVHDHIGNIAGVFNINDIIRGSFQSASLGFYAMIGYNKRGYMNAGLKLVLEQVFNGIQLHRIEANIQPQNTPSILLVKNNNFAKEGYSPNYLKIYEKWQDHERWALTYENWLKFNKK